MILVPKTNKHNPQYRKDENPQKKKDEHNNTIPELS
jgi:hypothetical protein